MQSQSIKEVQAMSQEFDVHFEDSSYPPVSVPANENLSEHLDACNSPILFGCRSGLCGTCLIDVVSGETLPPGQEEREALEIYAPGNPCARLACQIDIVGHLKVRKGKS